MFSRDTGTSQLLRGFDCAVGVGTRSHILHPLGISAGVQIHFKGDSQEAVEGLKVDLLTSACCQTIDLFTNSCHTCRQGRKPPLVCLHLIHWSCDYCLRIRKYCLVRHTFSIISQICFYFQLLSFPDASLHLGAFFKQ